ncbi:hypothetical protein [uncultured Mycobacterium sp.]|uniref:hypothetical protein n=1 Tax=uncultured Mycobacterium sp. TaxID=171292 RepID=UPI0035CC178F
MSLFSLLNQAAMRFPDRRAVYHGHRRFCSWREIYHRPLRRRLERHLAQLERRYTRNVDMHARRAVINPCPMFTLGELVVDELTGSVKSTSSQPIQAYMPRIQCSSFRREKL